MVKDRLWFFGTVRAQGNSNYITNMYYNKNAGNPNAWLYVKDEARQAFNDKTWQNASGRITAQVTPRNKVNIFWDEQQVCKSCENGGNYANATTSPEANGYGDLHPMRFQQATWTSPVNNKLLLEGGFGYFFSRWGGRAKENPNTEALMRIIEQCAAGCAANGGIPNLMYRSQTTDLFSDGRNKNITTTWRAAASYVTGRQSLKVGYTANQLGDIRSANRGSQRPALPRQQRRPEPVHRPTSTTSRTISGCATTRSTCRTSGRWAGSRCSARCATTMRRAGRRSSGSRAGSSNAPLSWERTPVVDAYNDITPRFSAAYDVFGNGKTAIKGTLGKYLESTVTASNYSLGNPTSRIATNSARTWTDANAQLGARLRLPQPGDAGQPRGWRGGDFCGVISQPQLRHVELQQHHRPGHPAGLGRAPVGLELGRVGAAGSAAARVGRGRLLPPRVLRLHGHRQPRGRRRELRRSSTITAPQDSRLPDGGGYAVGPIFDLNTPSLAGVTRNYITYSDTYGDQYQKFNGIDVNFSARPRSGLTAQGGFSGGKARRRQLRDPRQGAGDLADRRYLEPVLPRRDDAAAAVQGAGQLHHPEGGRAGERDVHEQAGHQPERLRHAAAGRRVPGQLRGAERHRRADPRASAGGQRAEHHGEHHRALRAGSASGSTSSTCASRRSCGSGRPAPTSAWTSSTC